MNRCLQFSVFVVLLIGCSKPVPTLDGFDATAWKNDRHGCSGTRIPFIATIRDQKDKLRGLSESDLVSLLGKADRNDLSEHHQKFYYYFIEPAPDCANGKPDGLKLIVR